MPEEFSGSSKITKSLQGRSGQNLFQDIPEVDQSVFQILNRF